MSVLKRIFGLLAVLTGLAMLIFGVGHPFLDESGGFKLRFLVVGVLFGGAFLSFGKRWLLNEVDLQLIGVDPDDPILTAATSRARATLKRFWTYLAEGRHECFVKFPLSTRSGEIEHIWGVVHSREGEQLIVSLANDPVDEPVSDDSRKTVPVSEIEDWQVFVSDDEIRGGYSILAIAEIARQRGLRLSSKSRRAMRAFVDLEEGGGPQAMGFRAT